MPPRRRARRRRNAPIVPASFLRRRSTRWLIAASITLAIGIILGAIGGRLGGGGSKTPTPAVATTATAPATGDAPTATTVASGAISPPDLHPDASLLERAAVTHIVDGDTIDVRLGDRDERVRYYGIDTPERGKPCFTEATDRNRELAGDTVLLLPDARERDRFGRLLRYVFDTRGDSIDAALIAEGFAHAWTKDGSYLATLVALEAQAHVAGTGCLWTQ
jgi:micrococcal nuclease